MPTRSTPARDEELSKKTRSPARASASDATARPLVACCEEVRGRSMPRLPYTSLVKPEQSRPLAGSVPPHRQGTPRYLRASVTTALSEALPADPVVVAAAAVVPVSPAAVAAAVQ